MTDLATAILEIAKKNPEGFTVEVPSLKPVTDGGYIVACLETQNSFGKRGLSKVLEHALANGNVIGGWKNTDDGRFYFDSCKIFQDKGKAMEFAKANSQIAMFDLDAMTEVRL